MAIVQFNPDRFRETRPRFTADLISDAELEQAFKTACLILDNTERSIVPYDPAHGLTERETLLDLLTEHLATLGLWNRNNQSGPVSSASQGSVSVSFQAPQITDKNWFLQTPAGTAYRLAIQKYLVGGKHYKTPAYHPWG